MMTKISRDIVVLAGVLFCAVFLVGVSPAQKKQSGSVEQPVDPYKDSKVLVEAFVAEVKLDSLYESGVSPIGQKPNSVSIKNILECLKDKDSGQVTTGAKLAVRQNEVGSMSVEEKIYVERQQPVKSKGGNEVEVRKVFESYSIGKQFSAEVFVALDSKIRVEFNFRQNTLGNISSEIDGPPPNVIERNWTGVVCLEAGEPSIVGATQDEETAVFLILCADIENK